MVIANQLNTATITRITDPVTRNGRVVAPVRKRAYQPMKPDIWRGSPRSDFSISASMCWSTPGLRPNTEPSAGVKIRAMKIDEDSTKIRVSGSQLMYLPAMEFQNRNGRKADRVVSVPFSTGQNMRLPAMAKAWSLG